jgi:nicotinate-nucleotide adenylyltransferase
MSAIGVFGGTFDPVHFGHLRTAYELGMRLELSQVRFVPCSVPPHRGEPVADAQARVRMLEAAIADVPEFVVDLRELERPGPSYTVDTLASLRADHPDDPLCLLLGMDAFLGLAGWRDWRRLLDLAHIAVANRPGWRVPDDGVLGRLLEDRRAPGRAALHERSHGSVLVVDVTRLEIASSDIKRSIQDGVAPKYLLPRAVWDIIVETECYGA